MKSPSNGSVTPRKSRNPSGELTPQITDTITSPFISDISPVKTPKGKAGLSSPEKRSTQDLERSARKRANRTVNSRLVDVVNDEDQILDQQDLELAEKTIRRSGRNRKRLTYNEDSEDEELTRLVGKDFDEDSEDSDELVEISDDEYIAPKRQKRTAEPESEEETTPRKVGRPRKYPKVDTPPRKIGRPRTREERPKRGRVGRPSKADDVIGNVKSIFQMDDESFFLDRTSSPARKEETPETSTINFDNTGESTFSSVPVVSGIRKPESSVEDAPKRVFEPMPIPKLLPNGDIDPTYLAEHFPNISLDSKFKGKLADERAFFLEGSEGYFEQHSIRPKTSGNSLHQLAPQLDYREFIPYVQIGRLILSQERQNLHELHKSLYPQWCFELTQGFNVNLFGIGSKIPVMLDFLNQYFPQWYYDIYGEDVPPILVVNGYNPATKLKTFVPDLGRAIVGDYSMKFPKHISESVPLIMEYLGSDKQSKPKVILAINNIDGEGLRDQKAQNLLSQLCARPDVWLISSLDHVNVSLLWDSFRLKNYNFIWHDTTSYEPYATEMSFKDVLSMGKSKKFVGSKGATHVFSSVTAKSRSLYGLLLAEQLEVMKKSPKFGSSGLKGNPRLALSFKEFYQKCLEKFITSDEMSFRSMLGEYVEHKMCVLTKDNAGSEILFVPFNYDEIDQLWKKEFQKS